ncbi:hypothetical protein [Gandjariella thermophila]|uniref:hypothetical protein n=1 Tax=Gandjariella thermophila TaxID=1931992 RepID=UPI001863B396|nr:hypothetical protein [Gandjariella thermophila]
MLISSCAEIIPVAWWTRLATAKSARAASPRLLSPARVWSSASVTASATTRVSATSASGPAR